MPVTDATIRAVNGLTVRWAQVTDGGTVFSAPGVWPLLAFLADGASGAARTELAAALGVPAHQAGAAARELLDAMRAMDGLESALGLWTKSALKLREEWTAGLPAGTHRTLTEDVAASKRLLDAWAADRTGGLIEHMPVALDEATTLVLATALALRTDWQQPFDEQPLRPAAGPWQGRTLRGLRRRGVPPDRIGVADTPDGPVTALRVLGDNGIDVHLLLGADQVRGGSEPMTAGQVLGAGVGILAGRHPLVPGSRLPDGTAGPGLRVEQVPCTAPQPPTLEVTTVAFDVTADHDLLELHRLFGLTTAMDTSRPEGHFPGICERPPSAVGSARQSALARFGPLGFRAAAVTAVALAPAGMPVHRHTATVVRALFDRPFGFLAVHRESRLVLAAGWVTDPAGFAPRN